MATRDLIVRLIGDSRSVERAFTRSSGAARAFGRDVDGVRGRLDRTTKGLKGLSSGALFTGGIFAAAGAAAIKKTIDAAANAQNVLGQTKVALEDTGKSWEQYGAQIQSVVAAQQRLGFDDEELLKTFSLFERRTNNVTRALELNALATDVARARYVDLSTAATIVLKASLGQAGALRRIGIEARTGATGVELITALTEKYGGAARAASTDAVAANQRLQVSLQNIQETIGSAVLPLVTRLATTLSEAAEAADLAAKNIKKLGGINVPGTGVDVGSAATRFGKIAAVAIPSPITGFAAASLILDRVFGPKKGSPDVAGGAAAFERRFGLQASLTATAAGTGPNPFKVGKASPVITQLNTRLQSELIDAQLKGSSALQLKVLAKQKKSIEESLTDPRLKPGQITGLKNELQGVVSEITSIQDGIKQTVKDQRDALIAARQEFQQSLTQVSGASQLRQALAEGTTGIKDDLLSGLAQLKELRGNLAKATSDGIRAQIQQAINAVKDTLRDVTTSNKAIDRLDKIQSARNVSRDLVDSREALARAIQGGGKFGIREARRGLEDAQTARQRLALEGTSFRGSGSAITIIVNGDTDPEVTARRVVDKLNRQSRRDTSTPGGRTPGFRPF